jgi:hypothetical protein
MLKLNALPHFCHRNHLDGEMVRRWIGRGGPIALPPRSLDLTPLDFFLWGYVKNIVYKVKINYLQRLKARIMDAVSTVTPNTPQATWNEVEYRLDICRATEGACTAGGQLLTHVVPSLTPTYPSSLTSMLTLRLL